MNEFNHYSLMKNTCSLLAMLIAVFMLASCGGDTFSSKVEYVPFKSDKNNKWGLISVDGKVLFDDEFDEMPTIAMNGRFFVKGKDGYELYIAEDSPKQVGSTVWKEVCDFSEDVTPAVERGKAIVLINRDGETVKDMAKLNGKTVVRMTRFLDGVSIFENADGYSGTVDTNGNIVIGADYVNLIHLGEKRLLAVHKKYETAYKKAEQEKIKYSILDMKGKVLGEIDGKKIASLGFGFMNGVMAAGVTKDDDVCYGLMDEKGEWVVEPSRKVRSITDVKGKNFIFISSERKFGIMNFDGEVILRAKYDALRFISDDVLAAYDEDKDRDERWKLINIEGEQVGDEHFRSLETANLGDSKLCIVETDEDNYDFMDYDGQYIKREKGLDIYDIGFNSAAYSVESDYVDMDELVRALGITKDGFDNFKVGMGAEAAIKMVQANDSTISVDAEDYTYRTYVGYTKDLHITNASCMVSFDSPAGEAVTKTVTENFYGYTFSRNETVGYKFSATSAVSGVSASFSTNSGKLEGKGKALYKALATKLRGMGKTIKSNDNAIVVSLSENRYGVAVFTGTSVEIGVMNDDGSQIDISRFEKVTDGSSGVETDSDEWAVDSVVADSVVVDTVL